MIPELHITAFKIKAQYKRMTPNTRNTWVTISFRVLTLHDLIPKVSYGM